MIIFIDSQSSEWQDSVFDTQPIQAREELRTVQVGMPFAVSHHLLSRYSTIEDEGDDSQEREPVFNVNVGSEKLMLY